MDALTQQQLNRIMPNAGSRSGVFISPINQAAEEFAINTPARMAAFLAQIAVESGELRYLREIWGPTGWQLKYESHHGLGNIQPGDGKRFLGRGLIQLTGRANYAEFGEWLDLPLLDQPELLEQPLHAARSAACFWQKRRCNELADSSQFKTLTARINPGLLHYDRRLAYWLKAKALLGVNGG